MRRLAPLLAVLVSAACEPAELPEAESTSAPIIDGTIDFGDQQVVALTTGFKQMFCSGSIISSKVIMTAGHCVSGLAPKFIFIGHRVSEGGHGRFLSVDHSYPHPDYDPEDFRNADIGVVVLEGRADVEPARPNDVPLSEDYVGRSPRWVGFGYQEIGPAGKVGEKRQIVAPITKVTEKEFEYGVVTCNGDSGGPSFLDFPDGRHVIGVTSWGDASCKAIGGSTRVDRYAEWLAGVVEEEDPISCERDFRCADGCAEVDEDCPCKPDDGFCSALCADAGSDPDCPPGCGANDECVVDCPAIDPDCDPCLAEGHCLTECAERDPDCPDAVGRGELCQRDFDCSGGDICLPTTERLSVCTARCASDAECSDGQFCKRLAPGAHVCRFPAVEDAGPDGCGVARGHHPGPPVILGVLGVLAVCQHRRRRRGVR